MAVSLQKILATALFILLLAIIVCPATSLSDTRIRLNLLILFLAATGAMLKKLSSVLSPLIRISPGEVFEHPIPSEHDSQQFLCTFLC